MAITVATFAYRSNFIGLTDDQVQSAIDEVAAVWSGALSFWSNVAEPIRTSKRDALQNLLTAWLLADTYTSHVTGVIANGGMPLSKKTIGDVEVVMMDQPVQEAMRPFLTNTFGIRALQMIQSAPERFSLLGGLSGLHIPAYDPIMAHI